MKMIKLMLSDDTDHDDSCDGNGVPQRESFCYKLLPKSGTTWIRVNFAICGNFVFWARYEKCQEMVLLIFFGSHSKVQRKINANIYFGHNF